MLYNKYLQYFGEDGDAIGDVGEYLGDDGDILWAGAKGSKVENMFVYRYAELTSWKVKRKVELKLARSQTSALKLTWRV